MVNLEEEEESEVGEVEESTMERVRRLLANLEEEVEAEVGEEEEEEESGDGEVEESTMERVRRVLASHPLIDGHNDFPLTIRDHASNQVVWHGMVSGFHKIFVVRPQFFP